VYQLKNQLKKRGLSITGKNEDLVARLQDAISEGNLPQDAVRNLPED
jgi:hypothetical protein